MHTQECSYTQRTQDAEALVVETLRTTKVYQDQMCSKQSHTLIICSNMVKEWREKRLPYLETEF